MKRPYRQTRPSYDDAQLVAEMSADLHRPEGPSEDRMEKRDQVLADLLTVAYPEQTGQHN